MICNNGDYVNVYNKGVYSCLLCCCVGFMCVQATTREQCTKLVTKTCNRAIILHLSNVQLFYLWIQSEMS